ncbi:uncharacterized protein LOC143040602 isoform X2 [Oratosquilla oratoria]|uniref:uncharacterized protein LOC143040602 isoform X2 n=1 Tax=Oratosquilla oratoria TaxID=337810 RepID=UPI003F75FA1A
MQVEVMERDSRSEWGGGKEGESSHKDSSHFRASTTQGLAGPSNAPGTSLSLKNSRKDGDPEVKSQDQRGGDEARVPQKESSQRFAAAEGQTVYVNGHATNGEHEPPWVQEERSSKRLQCESHPVERHSEQSLLNNNLIEEKCNIRGADEKSYCLYHKFPPKVNNNVYPEKSSAVKDGMEEYFESHAEASSHRNKSHDPSCKEVGSALKEDIVRHSNQEPLNILNGEEDDEDEGCIYTYKGENIETNLSNLIDTCLSCGLPNTERSIRGLGLPPRLLNGSLRPNPPEQNNLFSPDMDFLEMDFDPGPNGEDGDVDSDCDDNCSNECDIRLGGTERNLISSSTCSGGMNPFGISERKANNVSPELRNLVCERCEAETFENRENKIKNEILDLNFQLVHCTDSRMNISHNPKSESEKRHNSSCSGVLKVEKDLNVLHSDLERLEKARATRALELIKQEEDNQDTDSIENNLGEADMDIVDVGDDDDDDADDEDGDDSNCERFDEITVRGGGSDEAVRSRDSAVHSTNNNLGSVSAPEVSPVKEYSPLDKLGRSVSFHNQLSSPKYENVCFPLRSSDGGSSSCLHSPGTSESTTDSEAANLEACTGRLHRRENSVFNIPSDPLPASAFHSSSSIPSQHQNFHHHHHHLVHHPGSPGSSSSSSASSHQHPHLFSQTSNLVDRKEGQGVISGIFDSSPSSVVSSVSSGAQIKAGTSAEAGSGCPLPVKSLRPKHTDPAQDPNTASEGEGGSEDSCPRVEKTMIWTERQATSRQVTQIGTSACGATAVINVLLALDYPHSVEEVQKSIPTRLRAEKAQVVEYLFSRSVAGTTHVDLIEGVTKLTRGAVKARFFEMYPKRALQLCRWLADWISKGGVPLATLNLQVGVAPGQTIPDAWHHQMVFGVGPQGVYLTNPLECVSDSLLADQLCTDSVLLVRRSDIVNRWGTGDKLILLTQHEDPRWRNMNVLGQVVGVVKEEAAPKVIQGRRHFTSHVTIPAAYKSGVTIFMRGWQISLCMPKAASLLRS